MVKVASGAAHVISFGMSQVEKTRERSRIKRFSRRFGGKLAESSDKSERGEPVCPKIHPNFSWLKVRTRFPQSDSLEKSRVLFKRKDAIQIFISCLSRVGFGCALSSMVSALSEDSAQNPSIGTDSSEPSANLPFGSAW